MVRRQVLLPSDTRTYHSRHSTRWVSAIGAEPGINPSDDGTEYGCSNAEHNRESEIRIIDYSDQCIIQHEVSNASLQSFLEEQHKPDWAACRWIYVNGVSWEVVRCLGHTQGLHPLAVEDVLNTNNPTKVDLYDDHCFIDMTLQKLVDLQQEDHSEAEMARRFSNQPRRMSYDSRDSGKEDLIRKLEKLDNPYRKFGTSTEQLSIFLTAKDTVITIFEGSGHDVFAPILTRLQSEHTILRSSNDPSMLLQSVIDAVVDLSIPIGKAFSDAFSELEFAVLTKPAVIQSRQLYVLRLGLTNFMDTVTPISSLVRTLSDHRTIPLESSAAKPSQTQAAIPSQVFASTVISPLTQAYLKDVQDHVTTLSSSTHRSIRSAENLTALIFNTIAAKQNESVRQLTLVSIFFLPLTFLTGYFGMNFDPMPIVNNNSDTYFWWIATPVMLTTVLLLMVRPAWHQSLRWMRQRSRK